MTAKQIELVNKQIEKVHEAYNKADLEEQELSKLLHRMGYNYNASFTNKDGVWYESDVVMKIRTYLRRM